MENEMRQSMRYETDPWDDYESPPIIWRLAAILLCGGIALILGFALWLLVKWLF